MVIADSLTKEFQDKFQVVLEDEKLETSQAANDLLAIATQLQDAITQHKRALDDAETQLANIIEQLNTKLGFEIRQREPKLMVTHGNGCCNAGYYSKNLGFRPDLNNRTWRVDGPMSRSFRREYPQALQLRGTSDLLADAVIDFFKRQFKTLG
jgi:hypothetical protein